MATSPIKEENTVASYTITSNGTEIPSDYGVMSISVSQRINTIAEAQISVRDGNASDQLFRITDAKTFEPGTKITISLGYNSKNKTVFSGIVIKQSISVDESGTNLSITCKDDLVKITKSKSKLVLSNAPYSDAIEQIATKAGIAKKVTATKVKQEKIVQYDATDWDFIVKNAESNGMVVLTDSGTLVVEPPSLSATPQIGLTYGRDILGMNVDIEAVHQYQTVIASFWDIDQQKQVEVEASKPAENKQGNLSDAQLSAVLSSTFRLDNVVYTSQEEAQAAADATLLKSDLARYQGGITFQGSLDIKPNMLIDLAGLGDRFNGNAYVSSVSHTLNNGQWRTEIQIGMSSEWFSQKVATSTGPEASGALKGAKGLQTAKVVQIYSGAGEDKAPEKEFKVALKIPTMNEDTEELIWARLSTFYASNGFGTFFYPEENDEVIIGFVQGDPRSPIILGSVYSSALPTPVPIENANNYIKALVTKSKMQFQFDDENIVMTFTTPNNNTITISDKDKGISIVDENSNKITLNADGITVESASSLTLKAAQEVSIQGQSVTIKASSKVSVSGQSCEINGGSSTDIKGAQINLN